VGVHQQEPQLRGGVSVVRPREVRIGSVVGNDGEWRRGIGCNGEIRDGRVELRHIEFVAHRTDEVGEIAGVKVIEGQNRIEERRGERQLQAVGGLQRAELCEELFFPGLRRTHHGSWWLFPTQSGASFGQFSFCHCFK
jgi:hypothetical protein